MLALKTNFRKKSNSKTLLFEIKDFEKKSFSKDFSIFLGILVSELEQAVG